MTCCIYKKKSVIFNTDIRVTENVKSLTSKLLYVFIYRLAEKHGVKLVYKQSFADFFDQHVQDRDHKNLLGRMKALEVR